MNRCCYASRDVRDTDCTLGGIHMLPTGATSTKNICHDATAYNRHHTRHTRCHDMLLPGSRQRHRRPPPAPLHAYTPHTRTDAQIRGRDVPVNFCRLRHHGDRRRRGVHTALRLSARDSLNPMHAALEPEKHSPCATAVDNGTHAAGVVCVARCAAPQTREGTVADDSRDHFFEALCPGARVRPSHRDGLQAPPVGQTNSVARRKKRP